MGAQGWEFLAAIKDKAPDAQAEVLAYSDWLEEQGRVGEAGLIRSAAAIEIRSTDDGKTRSYFIRIWKDGSRVRQYQPDHRIEEVELVRKAVSPKTLRRKLQKKLKRHKHVLCQECGSGLTWSLYEDDGYKWQLTSKCSNCTEAKRVYEWTGKRKPSSRGGTADAHLAGYALSGGERESKGL